MRIISERYTTPSTSGIFLSCIVSYNDRLFKVVGGPTKLFVWSGFNGWLYIDGGDSKDTTKEHIDQFLPVMKVFSDEKENC